MPELHVHDNGWRKKASLEQMSKIRGSGKELAENNSSRRKVGKLVKNYFFDFKEKQTR